MQFYIVDVFAEGQYTGNQLAVVRGNPDTETCQTLALEMNYAETTFITDEAIKDGGYDVRIFTPANEVPFAGHPTLGTAFIIQQEIIGESVSQVILNEKVGQIPVTFGDDGFLWMRQMQPEFSEIYPAEQTAAMLGVSLDDIDTRFPIQVVSTGLPFIIVPLRTVVAVQQAACDVKQLKAMIGWEQHQKQFGVFVFAPEAVQTENDIHARCFVHLHGVPEDPATGSANGCFAGWLAKNRYFGDGKVQARVEQGYEIRRPSLILLDAEATDEGIDIRVGGRVRMVARGELM